MAVGLKTKRQDKTWFLQYFTRYLKHTALNYPLVVIVCVCLCARVFSWLSFPFGFLVRQVVDCLEFCYNQ